MAYRGYEVIACIDDSDSMMSHLRTPLQGMTLCGLTIGEDWNTRGDWTFTANSDCHECARKSAKKERLEREKSFRLRGDDCVCFGSMVVLLAVALEVCNVRRIGQAYQARTVFLGGISDQ